MLKRAYSKLKEEYDESKTERSINPDVDKIKDEVKILKDQLKQAKSKNVQLSTVLETAFSKNARLQNINKHMKEQLLKPLDERNKKTMLGLLDSVTTPASKDNKTNVNKHHMKGDSFVTPT